MLIFVAFLLLVIVFFIVTKYNNEKFGLYQCTKYKELVLESVCTDRKGRHMWKVTNPNSIDVPFTWSYLVVNKGSGVALKKSTITFVAPRAGICTIKYRLGNKDYSDTEVFNLKICW